MADLLLEDPSVSEDELEAEPTPFKYAITSYGADYPVDGLVKRLRNGDIFNPPFQRRYVWNIERASLFIESLLLGLPVPGIFLSREDPTQRLLVIDGQQRLRSLQQFYDGKFGDHARTFKLEKVQKQFADATYESLSDEDRRRLDDSIIHATIIRQDQPSDDESSIYYIFHRLNTGGMELSSQEIRSAIYQGAFNELLENLSNRPSWKSMVTINNLRKKDQELILRFLALYCQSPQYSKPMTLFLNEFMAKNRDLNRWSMEYLTNAFEGVCKIVETALGQSAFKPRGRLNAAVAEAVMVGIARRLDGGIIRNASELSLRYSRLIADDQFMNACLRSTTDEESVQRRLQIASTIFSDVE